MAATSNVNATAVPDNEIETTEQAVVVVTLRRALSDNGPDTRQQISIIQALVAVLHHAAQPCLQWRNCDYPNVRNDVTECDTTHTRQASTAQFTDPGRGIPKWRGNRIAADERCLNQDRLDLARPAQSRHNRGHNQFTDLQPYSNEYSPWPITRPDSCRSSNPSAE